MSTRPVSSSAPITTAMLLADVGLKASGCVRWGAPLSCTSSGVYLVELREADPDAPYARAPLSLERVGAWIERARALAVDGARPSAEQLATRLAEFWRPEARVLYIGRATRTLSGRVADFRRHLLGRPNPHRGGQWIKALQDIPLDLVWATATPQDAPSLEEDLLQAFRARLARLDPSRADVEPARLLPFANLKFSRGPLKPHGITGASSTPSH